MQKLLTLLSLVLATVCASFAMPLNMKNIQFDTTRAESADQADEVKWRASVNLQTAGAWNIYSSKDENGNPVSLTREDLPVYLANFTFLGYYPDGTLRHAASFLAHWPSEYTMLDGDKSTYTNYDPVDFATLASSESMCKRFTTSTGVYPIANSDGAGYSCHPIMPYNKYYSYGIYDGQTVELSNVELELISYVPSGDAKARLHITMTDAANQSHTIDIDYDNHMKIAGWKKQHKLLPPLSDIHIFNVGQDFDRTLLYFLAIDSTLDLSISSEQAPFSKSTWSINGSLGEVNDGMHRQYHETYLSGYLTAPLDFTNPDNEAIFNMAEFLYYDNGPDNNIGISLPQYGIFPYYDNNPNRWWKPYVMQFMHEGMWDVLGQKTFIALNTPEGVVIESAIPNGDVVHAECKGKIIYHYDVNDMTKTREYDAVGSNNAYRSYDMPKSGNNHFTYTGETSVNSITDNSALTADSAVDVYTTSGVKVFSGVYADFCPAPNNLYIVRTADKTFKIATRQ